MEEFAVCNPISYSTTVEDLDKRKRGACLAPLFYFIL